MTDGILTSALVGNLTTAFTGNIAVLLPIGITIMGTMLGIKLIPKIIHKFL